MNFKVEITDEAHAEAINAYQWIVAHGSPLTAARWYSGLLKAIVTLQNFPERCPLAPENSEFEDEIRHLLYQRSSTYRILFTIDEKARTVHVLHVRHGAMDKLRSEPAPEEE